MNGWIFIFFILFVGVLWIWIQYKWIGPWRSLMHSMKLLSKGDINAPIPRPREKIHQEAAMIVDEIKGRMIDLENQHAIEVANLRGVLDSMTEGVMVVDTMGKIRMANEQFFRLFSLSQRPVGKSLMEALRNHKIHEFFIRASETGKVLGEEIVITQGQDIFFEVNALRLQGAGAGAGSKGVVFVFHDITRIRRLENVRKEFVTNASHELRTPLSIIKGYVETLDDGAIDDPQISRKFISIIHKHTERLSSLIEDMLELSRMESGRWDARIESVEVGPLVHRVIQSFQTLTERKKLSLHTSIQPVDLQWQFDSHLIERVIFNLLDNAIKYTPDKSQISISVSQDNDQLLFEVADSGQGIPKESIPHLFERFYRVDKARSNELGGTGLGLSIAKHIVQNHGGKIWVESIMGQGATFSFILPHPKISSGREPSK